MYYLNVLKTIKGFLKKKAFRNSGTSVGIQRVQQPEKRLEK